MFLLLVCALAAFRMAEMVVVDNGPFDVFYSLRGWAAAPNGGALRSTCGELLTCVHCSGFWFSIAFGVLYAQGNAMINTFILCIAIGGLQSIFAKFFGRS